MADKPMPWFRAYPEAAFDPKFEVAALQTGLDPLWVFGAWWKILCIAGNSPIRGSLYVTAMKRYSNDDVAVMLRISNEDCNELLSTFLELEMLEIDQDGAYHVKNWEKRQFGSDRSTERVKKYREKAKQANCNADETLQKRSGNVTVTPSETETETDIKRGAVAPLPVGEGKRVEFRDPVWDMVHGLTPPDEPPPAHPLDTTWIPNDILELGQSFLNASNLPPPPDKSTRGYWIRELRSMRTADKLCPDDIRRAVAKMRDTGGIIKSPESIRTVALDIRAANSNFHPSEVW